MTGENTEALGEKAVPILHLSEALPISKREFRLGADMALVSDTCLALLLSQGRRSVVLMCAGDQAFS